MEKTDLVKVIKFIEGNYSKKLNENEIQLLSNELKDYTYMQFEKELKNRIIDNIDFFSVQSLHKLIIDNRQDDAVWENANLNSCYWYEIEREWCEKNNKPYYDITKGPDYPLPPYKHWKDYQREE